MRKRALRKNFRVEVRRSLNRFLSIFFIVAMGVAFFSGIQASAPDMLITGDSYYDNNNLMDIRVIGTLGLTEQDIEELRGLFGIQEVEAGYMTDALCGEGEHQKVLHVESLFSELNQVTITQGRMPERSNECILDADFSLRNGQSYTVGDKITLILPEDQEDLLKTKEYEIVGIANAPMYMSFNRGSSTLGNGEVNGFLYVMPEVFDSEVYTVAYLSVQGAKEEEAYSQEYDDTVDRAIDAVKAISGARCEIRYKEVMDEANEELDKYRNDLEEGKTKLKDAKQDLEDGKAEAESELTKAKEDLESGESELEAGKAELADSLAELQDAKDQVASGEGELASKEQELADAENQVSSGEASLSQAEAQLSEKQAQYDKEAAKGKKEIKKGKKEIKKAQKELDQNKELLESKSSELAENETLLQSKESELNAAQAQYEEGAGKLQEAQNAAAGQKEALDAGMAEYNAQLAVLTQKQQEYDAASAQIAELDVQYQAQQQIVSEQQAQIDGWQGEIGAANDSIAQKTTEQNAQNGNISAWSAEKSTKESERAAKQEQLNGLGEDAVEEREQLAAEIAALDAAIAQLDGNIAGAQAAVGALQAEIDALNAGNAEKQGMIEQASGLRDTAAAQAAALQPQVDAGKAQLAEQKPMLDEGWAQLNASKAQLDAGYAALAELDQKAAELAAAKAQLDAGRAELEGGKAQLESGKQQLEEGKAQLESGQAELDSNKKKLEKSEEKLDSGAAQLQSGWNTINGKKQELAAARSQVNDGWSQLESGKQQLADSRQQIADGEQKASEAQSEIEENEQKIADGWKDYESGKKDADEQIKEGQQKISDAELELQDAEQQLDDANDEVEKIREPEWFVNGRDALPEYSGYGENAERMTNIGKVFPVLFFLVAALISLTTMTRMVEEERTQIGTMKALGYAKKDIASKYLKYALYATLGGSIFGILIGEKILPYIIIFAYGMMYNHIPKILIPYHWEFGLMAAGAALVCTLGATFSACRKELGSDPAVLMRPPSPKEGKRVWLEYIPFVWRHLSFIWKSTVRNLFRYKKRFFMTIIGIGGCMGLLLVGFGLNDSIMDIANIQYSELQYYDQMVIIDEDSSASQKQKLDQILAEDDRIEIARKFDTRKLTVFNGKKEYTPYLYVPESLDNLDQLMIFRDRTTHEQYELTDDGAIVTEKLANMLGLKVGDEIVISDTEKGDIAVPITDIAENYLYHYVYMTPKVYEKYYGGQPDYNCVLIHTKDDISDEEIRKLGTELLKLKAVLNVTYTSSISDQLEDMLGSLYIIVAVLIISAGMLAFVVLYNLNNININERRRELATLKVLGFYDGEVSAYVYRENILLTAIGALVGIGFGILLHRFIITTVEVDACMFGRNIKNISFLYGVLFTFGFSAFVNLMMHFRLKKIDMVESLKSVE